MILYRLHEGEHSEDSEPHWPKRKEEVNAMTFLLRTECDDCLTTPTWKEEIEQFKKDLQLHHDANVVED